MDLKKNVNKERWQYICFTHCGLSDRVFLSAEHIEVLHWNLLKLLIECETSHGWILRSYCTRDTFVEY